MTGLQLKLIAIIAMVIDHVGAILFPELLILRFIGRITLPIMAYLLVEGMAHTRNPKKYIATLLAFAILAEPISDYALFDTPFYFGYQNVLFTLALGGFLIYAIAGNHNIQSVTTSVYLLFSCILSELLSIDGGAVAMCMILGFYVARETGDKKNVALVMVLVTSYTLVLYNFLWPYWGLLLSIPLLWVYNGERGFSRDNNVLKYGFYFFYPLHLLVIGMIK